MSFIGKVALTGANAPNFASPRVAQPEDQPRDARRRTGLELAVRVSSRIVKREKTNARDHGAGGGCRARDPWQYAHVFRRIPRAAGALGQELRDELPAPDRQCVAASMDRKARRSRSSRLRTAQLEIAFLEARCLAADDGMAVRQPAVRALGRRHHVSLRLARFTHRHCTKISPCVAG